MKSVVNYPVTLGFGAISPPYSASNKHHGIDYGSPLKTPLIVSGTQLGLSGNTGLSTGPHCHIDKNKAYPAPNRKTYLNPRGWSKITGKVIFAGKAGTAGNMVVVKTRDYYYRFLHLERIDVAVGATIGDSMECKFKNHTAEYWYNKYQAALKSRDTYRNRLVKVLNKVGEILKGRGK